MRYLKVLAPLSAALLSACGGSDGGSSVVAAPAPTPITGVSSHVIASFAAPWSLAFLPDGRLLVTERPPTSGVINPTALGAIRLVSRSGTVSMPIAGLPRNVGMLDVLLSPAYARTGIVYVSFMERTPRAARIGRGADDARVDPAGLAVARLRLTLDAGGGATFDHAKVIWRQTKVVSLPGSGEPGGRMTFSPDGRYLFVSAGDRQEFEPAQALDNTIGKIIRIYPDGAIPSDNPFVATAGAKPEIWSLGHRNPYGLAFDVAGRLWENEMGPQGGDELNLITAGANYGWPNVSYGDNYDGPRSPDRAPATAMRWRR